MHSAYAGLMRIDDLARFIALAEHENVTAAAEQLRTPQPTLSRALARVEKGFGSPLFEREARGLRLNPRGQVAVHAARVAMATLERAREDILRDVDPHSGLVRLAFLHSVSTSVLPDLLGRFRQREPGIRFELRQEGAPATLEDLRGGVAELGIVGPRPHDEGLGWRVLEKQRLRLAVPANHPMAGRRRMFLREAAEEPFIVVQRPLEFRTLTERLCRQAGFTPRVEFESSDLGTVEGLVGAGLGVAVLPIWSGQRVDRPPASIPLADRDASRDIGLVWRTAVELSAPARVFRDYVVERGGAGGGGATGGDAF
jgi:LysR family transcriptional activator of glutamate synthase operon